MQAVILAAGDGTRLGDPLRPPKVLVKVAGQTLLQRSLSTLHELGIREFVVVTGYRADLVEEFLSRKGLSGKYDLLLVHNPHWDKGNAYSVLATRGLVRGRFLVAMGDHIFDPQILKGLWRVRGDFVGVFDSAPRHIELAETTKAKSQRGHVQKVGRRLRNFKYVDAGLFLCSERIFPVIEKCLTTGKDNWNDVKREWIKNHDLHIYDLAGGFWMDIDTPEDLRKAERLLLPTSRPRDGVVARYLNRRLSRSLTRLLASTPITPNQVSFLSFATALLSAFLLAMPAQPFLALGGLLAQLSSVLDGCDGELARVRGTASCFGDWMDALLDRVADAAILFAMAYGLYMRTGELSSFVAGFMALAGSFLISYSESRYEEAFRHPLIATGFRIPAKRDTRLFLIMLGGLFDQRFLILWLVALLSFAEVSRRVLNQLLRETAWHFPARQTTPPMKYPAQGHEPGQVPPGP